jgi:hypothetical protein
MERGHKAGPRFGAKALDTLFHFACGLVRECDGENFARPDAFGDQISDS